MISDEQVINSLINHYRAKGLDVASVLDSPMFTKLSTQTQVELLRKYAAVLATGGNGFTSHEKKSLLGNVAVNAGAGALTGLGFAAMNYSQYGMDPDLKAGGIHVNSTFGRTAALGAALGGLSGLIPAAMAAYRARNRRNDLATLSGFVARTPTDDMALRALTHMHSGSQQAMDAVPGAAQAAEAQATSAVVSQGSGALAGHAKALLVMANPHVAPDWFA
jgi:hypothetical protein